jgi:hypothetical protein
MRVTLVNFSDAVRVVRAEPDNRPVRIEIGRSANCDLHPTMVQVIHKGMLKGDGLLIVNEDVRFPKALKEIVKLMADMDDTDEVALTKAVGEVLGVGAIASRPSRVEMRDILRQGAQRLIADNIGQLAGALTGTQPTHVIADDVEPPPVSDEPPVMDDDEDPLEPSANDNNDPPPPPPPPKRAAPRRTPAKKVATKAPKRAVAAKKKGRVRI